MTSIRRRIAVVEQALGRRDSLEREAEELSRLWNEPAEKILAELRTDPWFWRLSHEELLDLMEAGIAEAGARGVNND